MRLAVLDLCVWLPLYQYDQPRFGTILADWVRLGLPEADLTIIPVVEGASLPHAEAFDGFVLSGSDLGVYDTPLWMQPLRAFLLAARDAKRPIFGVCFGHQIMADTFGGKAEKVGSPEVGVRKFNLERTQASAHVWHQDQVTQVPPRARVIGSANYCPVAALTYDFPAMSVQFHPEYPPDYVSTFLQRSRGQVLSEEASDAAIAQFDLSDVDANLFADQMGAFFRSHFFTKTG